MFDPRVGALTWVGLKKGRTTCLTPMCGGSNLDRVEGGEDDMLDPHVEALTWVGLKEGRTICLAHLWRL